MESYQDPYEMAELLLRYLRNSLKPDEQQIVEAWLNASPENRGFLARLQSEQGLAEEKELLGRSGKAAAWKQIEQIITPQRRWLWPRMVAAASILIILSVSVYFILKPKPARQQTAQMNMHDIAPGHNQATLTLANGQKIILTQQLKGKIATQGHTIIQATGNNIIYNTSQQQETVSYNTLTTARGEQSPYPLILADGTKVWLNAQSSIIFPTVFPGKERVVKITGEVYFEVAHNEKQPFRVQTENQIIEDIGTEFDVNTYHDEQAATTLVEGSIAVNGKKLEPGQQSDGTRVKTVNVAQFIAWKNGEFNFADDDIQTIMRQLNRWYDIDVRYNGPVPQDGFSAIISRQRNISAVLNLLEKTQGVHFKIEGRRVTISQ